jgi:hypothetical protein
MSSRLVSLSIVRLVDRSDENLRVVRSRHRGRGMRRRNLNGLRVKLESDDMAEPYYFVRVAKSESWARYGSSDLLVQLVCRDHAQLYESDRERWARQLARDAMVERYPAAAEDIGYTDAKRYSGNVPATLRATDFPAPCGCRVWYWSGA